MKSIHQAINAAFIVLSVVAAWMSWHLKFSVGTEIGPGLMPFGAAVLLGGVSLIGFVRATATARQPLPADFLPHRTGVLRVGAVILALIGAILLLKPLGFVITTFALLILLPPVLGRGRPLTILLVAITGSLGVYYVFTHWLRVPLPAGILAF